MLEVVKNGPWWGFEKAIISRLERMNGHNIIGANAGGVCMRRESWQFECRTATSTDEHDISNAIKQS